MQATRFTRGLDSPKSSNKFILLKARFSEEGIYNGKYQTGNYTTKLDALFTFGLMGNGFVNFTMRDRSKKYDNVNIEINLNLPFCLYISVCENRRVTVG